MHSLFASWNYLTWQMYNSVTAKTYNFLPAIAYYLYVWLMTSLKHEQTRKLHFKSLCYFQWFQFSSLNCSLFPLHSDAYNLCHGYSDKDFMAALLP